MSDGKKYYCFCGSNCKYETMTKEQILAAIAQAVETGEVRDVDTGFVTQIKEKNGGSYVSFWVGTQAQYNAIANKETNCMYIITDDTTAADLENKLDNTIKNANIVLNEHNEKLNDLNGRVTTANSTADTAMMLIEAVNDDLQNVKTNANEVLNAHNISINALVEQCKSLQSQIDTCMMLIEALS